MNQPTVDRYNSWAGLPTGLVGVLMLAVSAYVTVGAWYRGDALFAVSMALVGMFSLFMFAGCLMRPTILVSDEGIGVSFLGLGERTLPWNDVEKIRKSRVSNGYQLVHQYRVLSRVKSSAACRFVPNLCGDIIFTHDFYQLDKLLAQIGGHAQKHGIRLVSVGDGPNGSVVGRDAEVDIKSLA